MIRLGKLMERLGEKEKTPHREREGKRWQGEKRKGIPWHPRRVCSRGADTVHVVPFTWALVVVAFTPALPA